VNSSRFPRVVGSTAEVTVVGLFLATVFGLVSLFFAIEARVASHEFRFLGLGVLLSSAGGVNVCSNSGVDIHVVSSLRGGVFVVPPIVVSSLVVILPIGLLGREFECLEESLTCLGELGCRLPFEMGFVSLFFPLFERPRGVCGGVEVGGINDGTSESFGHSMFQGFNSSLVI